MIHKEMCYVFWWVPALGTQRLHLAEFQCETVEDRQSHVTFAGGSILAAGSSVAIAVGLAPTSDSRLVSGLDSALGSNWASDLASRTGGGGSALSAGMALWGPAMRAGVRDLELLLQASRLAQCQGTLLSNGILLGSMLSGTRAQHSLRTLKSCCCLSCWKSYCPNSQRTSWTNSQRLVTY